MLWTRSARAFLSALNLRLPIVQAPMASAVDWRAAAGVARAGGLGSIPCAMLTPDAIADEAARFRAAAPRCAPLNLNFFTYVDDAAVAAPGDAAAAAMAARQGAWLDSLAPYYAECGVASDDAPSAAQLAAACAASTRRPFGEAECAAVEALRPEIVSFHFGLPAAPLVARVRAAGCLVWSSATTTAEAEYLIARGVDGVIAQGTEAGGHRGSFLGRTAADDASRVAPPSVGTLALVPQACARGVGAPTIGLGGGVAVWRCGS